MLESCERILRAQPKLWPHDLFVRFKEVGGTSLDVEILAWFETTWEEFTLIRQEVLLQFLEAVEKAGARLASPTQTVNVVTAPPPPNPPGRVATSGRRHRREESLELPLVEGAAGADAGAEVEAEGAHLGDGLGHVLRA